MNEDISANPYRFSVGQVVHHKRYDYRGVVFGQDPQCRADEDWYHKNQTQPDRNQPWYHVLVHGSHHTTYVAESNLEADESGQPIVHPYLDQLFSTFLEGRYYHENLN